MEINIYENKSENTNFNEQKLDDILNELESLKFQNEKNKQILRAILKLLERDVSSAEKTNTGKNKSSNNKKNKQKEVKIKKEDNTDKGILSRYSNYNLSNRQKKIIKCLESTAISEDELQKFTDEIVSKYATADSETRKKILKKNYTLNKISDKINEKKHNVMHELYRSENSLYHQNIVEKIALNPNYNKSPLIFVLVNNPSEKKKQGKKKSDFGSKKYVMSNKSCEKIYNDIEVKEDGKVVYKHKRNKREIELKYNIHDIFYIKSRLERGLTYDDFTKLLNKNNEWNNVNLNTLIYNIENNSELQNILEKIKNNILNCEFDRKGTTLTVNGDITHISTKQALDWCYVYVNSDDREDLIYTTQKRFQELNPLAIRCIFYNYNNQDLIDVCEEETVENIFVENNPSKRRNLIQNGGFS